MSVNHRKSIKSCKNADFVKKGKRAKKRSKLKRLGKAQQDESSTVDDDVFGLSDQSDEGSDGENKNDSTMQNESDDANKWYEEVPWNVSVDDILEGLPEHQLRQEAIHIFEDEVTTLSGKLPVTIDKTDFNWIKTVISRGTLSDKIAAYVLLIQDNPVVNIGFLRNMVSMVKVGKKRECFMTMDTLVDLFLENLLPPNRKLRYFAQQPHNLAKDQFGPKRRRLLMLWYLEDQLKAIYGTFLQALNDAAHDSVDANKEKVIMAMYKLLKSHPEQEAVLLTQIVNKLGDPSHKIGSKVIYTLTQLLDSHPNMQGVVMDELERFIFRPNMNRRAQYYSVCFLSQFTYDLNASPLASKAIYIYFSLFKACIKTGEIDTRMMSALLTGVSRAYPFSEKNTVSLTEHINTVYKVVHLTNANVAIHALCLLSLVEGEKLSDRFMTALYKKVGEPKMFCVAHHAMFLSLIFRVLKRDRENSRVSAFIKRLLQVCLHLSVPLICGILVLISRVLHMKKNKLKLETEASSLITIPDDDGEEHYTDVLEIKLDPDTHEEEKTSPAEVKVKKEDKGDLSWYHMGLKPMKESSNSKTYDPYERNPLYANGDKATFPELSLLARHFHPSVSLFATNILEGVHINYSGDPLQDFTLIRFLEKFVFKNPKQPKPVDNQLSTFSVFSRKKCYSMVGLKKLRVNTSDYLNTDEKIVPVDEKFMYKYLKEKAAAPVVKKEKRRREEDEDSETESLADDEFETLMRGVGGLPNDDDDDDVDFINAIGQIPSDKSQARGIEDEEDDADDRSDEEDNGDEDDGGDSDDGSLAEDFEGDEVDDWGEGDEMISDEDDQPFLDEPKAKRKKIPTLKRRVNSGKLFAAAEEFAELLEDENFQGGSSSAVSNKDKAGMRQLNWESSRDRWIKGSNFKKSKLAQGRKGNKGPAASFGGNKKKLTQRDSNKRKNNSRPIQRESKKRKF